MELPVKGDFFAVAQVTVTPGELGRIEYPGYSLVYTVRADGTGDILRNYGAGYKPFKRLRFPVNSYNQAVLDRQDFICSRSHYWPYLSALFMLTGQFDNPVRLRAGLHEYIQLSDDAEEIVSALEAELPGNKLTVTAVQLTINSYNAMIREIEQLADL